MFAHRVEFDVFHQDDLTRFRAENGAVDNIIEVLSIAVGEKFERACRARGRSQQSFALRILSYRFEQTSKHILHARELGCAAFRQTSNPTLGRFQFRFAVV